MSMTCCSECGRFVDSDDDPECFQINAAGKDIVVCEMCRDDGDEERALFETGKMQ